MSMFIKYLGALLLVLVTFTFCYGQDSHVEQIDRTDDVKRPNRIELRLDNTINEHSILERLDELRPNYTSSGQCLLNEICPRISAPGEIRIKYDGLQKVITGRLISYHSRLWNDSISDRFYRGNASYLDFQRFIETRFNAESDNQQDHWWERRWDQSLPEEKGGAGQFRTITIGRELSVFEFGEIRLTNTGQLRLGSFFFFYIRSTDVDTKTQTLSSIGSSFIRSKEVKINNLVDVSVKPRISVRTTATPEDILSNVSVEVRFRFFTTHRKEPIATLTINAESRPMQDRASLRVSFELFCW